MGVLFSGLGQCIRSDWSFVSSSGMLAQSSALSVYLPFLFPSLFFLFGFLCAFSLHLARCHACMDAQVGSAFQVPSFSYVRSYVHHRPKDGITGPFFDQIRSDNQSINQGKKNSNNPCFPLQLLLFSNVKCLIPLIHLHTSDLTQHHSNSCRNMENIFPLLACILIDWPQTIQR
jgi:hypothetical protein